MPTTIRYTQGSAFDPNDIDGSLTIADSPPSPEVFLIYRAAGGALSANVYWNAPGGSDPQRLEYLIDGGTPVAWSIDATTMNMRADIDLHSFNDAAHQVEGTAFDDIITAASEDDWLAGGAGNDILDGHSGDDIMVGGTGNDLYYVESSEDLIIEEAGEGVDTVIAALTFYALSETVENLTASGVELREGVVFVGNDLANAISGTSYDDILDGGSGNDVLSGSGGRDVLFGGDGDDVFRVENAMTQVIESAGGGNDTIVTSVSFRLGDDVRVETIATAFTARGLTITGNRYANDVTGTDFADTLFGGAGNDAIHGGNGNDRIEGNTGNDVIDTGQGADRISGGDGNDALYGGSENDVLNGGSGVDLLNGETGADTMTGGLGNDTFHVDSLADRVIELAADEGMDTVFTTVSGVVLADGAERLTAVATGIPNGPGYTLYGNAASGNVLTGSDAQDTLYEGPSSADFANGTGGADILIGLGGDDLYFVGSVGSVVREAAGEGYDIVQTTIAYKLPINVEAGVLLTAAAVALTGNDSDNLLVGGSGVNQLAGGPGADSIEGGAGADVLIGGAGADIFLFRNVDDSTPTQRDRIADFERGTDRIDLSAVGPGGLPFTWIGSAAFSGAAGEVRFYQQGALTIVSGDRDGNGVSDLQIALNGTLALTVADFLL